MDIRKLQRAIVDGLEDVKAQAITVLNTEALSPLFERVIIATGASNRQTKSLAASVRDKVRERGLQVMRTEGEENGEWIIVDCGAAVVHIMQPAIREYYHLEEIWGGKPVRMKLGAAVRTGLVKASQPVDDAERPQPPHRAEAAATRDGKAAAPAASKRGASMGASASASPKTSASARGATRRVSAPRQPAGKGKVRTVVAGKPARKTAAKTVSKGTSKAVSKTASKAAARSGASTRRRA